MKRLFSAAILFIFSALSVFSQCSVKGKVFDQKKSVIEGVNVYLLSIKDTSLISGDFFLTGEYEMHTQADKIFLRIGSFGYADTTLTVDFTNNKNIVLSDIQLLPKSINLNEIQVKASLPTYSMKNDKMIMLVENSVLSNSGNAVDVLSKTAKVMVNNDEDINVIGRGNALIYVDGKLIPDNSALKNINSDEIYKIEIISNPSAKYEAKGKAVINIITKKAKNNGSGGKIFMDAAKRTNWTTSLGGEFSNRTTKTATYVYYNFNADSRYRTRDVRRDYTNSLNTDYVTNYLSFENFDKSHSIKFSNDFILSPKHTIGIQVNGDYENGTIEGKSIIGYYAKNAGQNDYVVNNFTTSDINRKTLGANINYTFQPKQEGFKLFVAMDSYNYRTQNNQIISEKSGNSIINSNNTNSETNILINSLKTDITLPLPKDFLLETGIKYANTRNNALFETSISSVQSDNGDFKFEESYYAAYAVLNKQFGKIACNAGLRAEGVKDYAFKSLVIQDTTQWGLFPSFSMSLPLGSKIDLSINYTRRIALPSYRDLDPSRFYIDTLTYEQGNPQLLSEFTNSFEMNWMFMKFINLSLSYANSKNTITPILENDPSDETLTRSFRRNIQNIDNYGADLVLPYQNKWMMCQLISSFHYFNISNTKDYYFHDKDILFYNMLVTSFNLPWKIKLNITGTYQSPGIYGVLKLKESYGADATISRNFYNDRISASLLFSDIFNTQTTRIIQQVENVKYDYYGWEDRHYVKLSVKINLNKLTTNYVSKSAIEREVNRIQK